MLNKILINRLLRGADQLNSLGLMDCKDSIKGLLRLIEILNILDNYSLKVNNNHHLTFLRRRNKLVLI